MLIRPWLEYIDGGDARVWSIREPNLIVSSLDPEATLKKITADFIASQSIEWLHRLYIYLAGRDSYQKFVKDKPIFLDQQGQAIPAFDAWNQLILFLPDDDIDGYKTVNAELLSDESTREFIEKFGIKKPSLRDEIYNKILPAYNSTSSPVNADTHFSRFFRYFKECKNEDVSEFIKLIKDKAFLLYTTAGKNEFSHGKADDIYMPTEDLQTWFTTKPETPFLFLDKYHEMFSEKEYPALKDFFKKLGIADRPKIITEERYIEWQERRDRHLSLEGHSHKLYEKTLMAVSRSWQILTCHGHSCCGNYFHNSFTSLAASMYGFIIQIEASLTNPQSKKNCVQPVGSLIRMEHGFQPKRSRFKRLQSNTT